MDPSESSPSPTFAHRKPQTLPQVALVAMRAMLKGHKANRRMLMDLNGDDVIVAADEAELPQQSAIVVAGANRAGGSRGGGGSRRGSKPSSRAASRPGSRARTPRTEHAAAADGGISDHPNAAVAAALLAAEDDVLAGPSRDPHAPPLLLDQTPYAQQEQQGSGEASSMYPLLPNPNHPSEGADAHGAAESDRPSVDSFPPAPPRTTEEADDTASAHAEDEQEEESNQRRRLAAAEAMAFPPLGLDAASATIFGDDDADANARPAQFGEPLAEMGSGMPPALGKEGDGVLSGRVAPPPGPPPGPPPAYRAGSSSVPPLVDLASSLMPGSDDEGDEQPAHTATGGEVQ
jgi:hypothetical protein